MKNESRRRFLKTFMPAAGGWWLTANLSLGATFLKLKRAAAQLVPIVATRARKIVLMPSYSQLMRSKDGLSLTSVSLPLILTTDVQWADIAWNGSVYCAIGAGAASATTTNLSAWTQHSTPYRNGGKRIISKGAAFYLVPSGPSSTIATSSDGITWTTINLPVTASWTDLVWNGSIFCLLAMNSATVLTSSDGVAWSQQTLPVTANAFRVVWDGSVFCIVNINGVVLTSPDAVTWTQRTNVSSSNIVDACVDSGKIYVIDSTTRTVQRSTDSGITFSVLGVAVGLGPMGIAVAGTTIAMPRLGGSLYYSTNSGASWTTASTFTSSPYGGIRYVNSTFIQLGSENGAPFNGAATSTNGTTWTSRAMPAAYAPAILTKVASAGPKMCALSYTMTNACFYSSDYGATWSTSTFPVSSSWGAIATNGTIFCAMSYASLGSAYTSADGGMTWTTRALPITASWTEVVWNGTLFCAINGSSSNNIALTSPNGVTWTQRTLPSTQVWTSIVWNGALFVLSASSSNIVATSPDGVTWTQRTLPMTSGWSDMCWTGTHFVLIGSGSKCVTSPDGIVWTSKTDLPSGFYNFIVWNGVELLAVNASSTAVSHDLGTTWTAYTRATTFGYISNLVKLITVSQ